MITTLLLSLIGVAGLYSQELTRDTTFRADGNPILRHKYTADPAAMVYKGSFRRSVCIDRLFYNKDGTMKQVKMTTEGVSGGK